LPTNDSEKPVTAIETTSELVRAANGQSSMQMVSLSVLLAYVVEAPAKEMFVGCRNSSREMSKLALLEREAE
jgi:hypothetical protein